MSFDKHDNKQLLGLYEEELDRSGAWPYADSRSDWEGTGWKVFEMRDEILRRMEATSK